MYSVNFSQANQHRLFSNGHAVRTAELSSVLSLHLKHSRQWRGPILVGSVDIQVGELLEQCKNNHFERGASEPSFSSKTTLTLRDDFGREAGSLVVGLLDPAALTEKLTISLPDSELIQNAAQDNGDSVLHLLRQVVDKTEIAANLVGGTTEVRITA